MNTNVKQMAQVADQLPATTPMDLLQAAVANNVDVDQLGKLMDLQERYESNQAKRAFTNAMADFQARCPTVLKSKRADRYNYAPLDEVLRTIRPHLDSTGLSVRFSTTMTETTVLTALCTISHRDGHSETSEFAVVIDDQMRVNATQKIGSANSYARRYSLMNALSLVASDADDDGYAAATPMITDKQIVEIQDHMDALKIDQGKFFKYLKIDSLENMPASQYPLAMKAIERKQKAADK